MISLELSLAACGAVMGITWAGCRLANDQTHFEMKHLRSIYFNQKLYVKRLEDMVRSLTDRVEQLQELASVDSTMPEGYETACARADRLAAELEQRTKERDHYRQRLVDMPNPRVLVYNVEDKHAWEEWRATTFDADGQPWGIRQVLQRSLDHAELTAITTTSVSEIARHENDQNHNPPPIT